MKGTDDIRQPYFVESQARLRSSERSDGCRIDLSWGEGRLSRATTPVMEAKIADHLWVFAELLAHSA